MGTEGKSALLSLAVLIACSATHASVYNYDGFKVDPQQVYQVTEAVWASGSVVPGPPGDGSYIKLDATIEKSDPDAPNLDVHFVVFHSSDEDKIGYYAKGTGSVAYCCTEELQKFPGCNEPGSIILNPSVEDSVKAYPPIKLREKGKAPAKFKYEVTKSGYHTTLFLTCGGATPSPKLTGRLVYMNPYGYLPGNFYPLLMFFGAMSIGYLVLGVIWAWFCIRYWRELLQLQFYITFVIALGMIEKALAYFYHLEYNISGEMSVVALIFWIVFMVVKKTLSRVLVLIVSMGFGTVIPRLGDRWRMILIVAALYFIFEASLEVTEKVSENRNVRLMLNIPVAFLDAVYYWWIFIALSQTIEHLASRRQQVKLVLYTKFQRILVVSISMSILMQVVQMYMVYSMDIYQQWDSTWIFEASWYCLYALILAAIMFLWRPSVNNQAYAYSEQITMEGGDDEDDIEMETGLPNIADVSTVKPTKTIAPASFTLDDDDMDTAADKQD